MIVDNGFEFYVYRSVAALEALLSIPKQLDIFARPDLEGGLAELEKAVAPALAVFGLKAPLLRRNPSSKVGVASKADATTKVEVISKANPTDEALQSESPTQKNTSVTNSLCVPGIQPYSELSVPKPITGD